MQVEPHDPQSVLWLQKALSRLLPRTMVRLEKFDEMTIKAVKIYQASKGLPETGDADKATTDLIEQDLARLDAIGR